MNTKRIIAVLFCISIIQSATAREIRTPLPVWRQYNHYPIQRPKDNDQCWNFDVWGAGYFRTSDRAFKNFNTLETEQLSALFFGEPEFFGIQAFVPGSFDPINPFLQFATIRPQVCYNEKGAFFGFNVDRGVGCNACWHAGIRTNISFRSIKNELLDCCDLVLEDELADVCRMQREQVLDETCAPQVIEDAFAYRLDFLSALPLTVNAPIERLVKYGTGGSNNITMNQIDVTDAPALPINKNPIHVVQRDAGTPPPPPFTLVRTSVGGCPNVASLPDVGSTGAGAGGNNQRARFVAGTNYAPLGTDVVAQSRLWVVPTAADQSGTLGIVPNARAIQTAINSIIKGINTSVVDFFADQGIFFTTQKTQGAGDLHLEFYANRAWGCDLFNEFLFAIRFPTGVRVKDPGLLLKMPTGNNGHYEILFGAMQGWEHYDWLAVKLNGVFSFVLPHKENVAAPFRGATVKNIGPAIKGKVSWQYFVGDLDFTFMPPCNPRVGFDLGYQFYWKSKDKVRFDVAAVPDLFGVVQPLDANVIERRTNVFAHKIKTEVFYQGDYYETFAGWHHVFAGKNASKETDWYIGFAIYF